MKLSVPGIVISALLVASPAAFAQNTNTGNASSPGASVAKDDAGTMTKRSKKKHMASYKHRHHKAMSSKAQTTGSGNSSNSGTSVNKDDTTPKR